MPGWAIADASFAAVLAFVLGVLFVLVRIVTGPGWRDRHKD